MNPSRLARFALLLCGLLLAAACSAHDEGNAASGTAVASAAVAATASATAAATPVHFVEGKQYVRLAPPEGQAKPTGPVELVELFSYACPHCAEFAPYMDDLRAKLPKGVEVHYMPVVFSQVWLPSAQAFYAARQLGVLKQTHDAMFKAHLEHYPLNSLQDMATWYGRHGVDPQKFLAAATSEKTKQELMADRQQEIAWGIDGTPTLVVGRRASDAKDAPFVALMRSADFGNYATLQQLGLWMVDEVRKH